MNIMNMIEQAYNEHGFIIIPDTSISDDDYYSFYGEENIGELAMKELEDDEYCWIEEVDKTISDYAEKNGLKLFSCSDDIGLIYCKPCDKEKVVDWISEAYAPAIEDYYNKYLLEMGYYVTTKYNYYDLNPNFDKENISLKSYDEFFNEWIENRSLI